MDTGAVQVADGVWQAGQPLSPEVPLYVHLVVGRDAAALVDGGLPSSLPMVERLIAASGAEPAWLLNTHAHHDHIGTFATLRERFDARVVAAPGAVRWIEDPERNLREFALHHPDLVADTPALRAELGPTFDRACSVDLTVADGACVRLGGGVGLTALEVPGHLDAELAWVETRSRTLLLGDVVTGTSWSFFHGHTSPRTLRRSLDRLRVAVREHRIAQVCMSHYAPRGPADFDDLLTAVGRHVDEVSRTVLSELGDRPRPLGDIWRATCARMGRVEEFRGLAMVEAHLFEAVEDGRARQEGPGLYRGVASTSTGGVR